MVAKLEKIVDSNYPHFYLIIKPVQWTVENHDNHVMIPGFFAAHWNY